MNKKEILRILHSYNFQFILIGGTALNFYNSPRVTQDLDFAIKTIEVDDVIEMMYEHNFYMIKEIQEEGALFIPHAAKAQEWISETKHGSMSFIYFSDGLSNNPVPFEQIDISTQVDFLFELSVPAVQLKRRSRKIDIDDFSVAIASPEDLLTLKNNRKEKNSSDYSDIDFIQNNLLKDTQ